MLHKTFHATLGFSALLLACAGPWVTSAQAGHGQRHSVQGDHFYNYYADSPGGVPAQLYVSPRPTPPLVGHTYYTYQPLLPHEFMYKHQRTYYHPHPMGTTVTKVRYRPSFFGQINPIFRPAPPRPVGWQYPAVNRWSW